MNASTDQQRLAAPGHTGGFAQLRFRIGPRRWLAQVDGFSAFPTLRDLPWHALDRQVQAAALARALQPLLLWLSQAADDAPFTADCASPSDIGAFTAADNTALASVDNNALATGDNQAAHTASAPVQIEIPLRDDRNKTGDSSLAGDCATSTHASRRLQVSVRTLEPNAARTQVSLTCLAGPLPAGLVRQARSTPTDDLALRILARPRRLSAEECASLSEGDVVLLDGIDLLLPQAGLHLCLEPVACSWRVRRRISDSTALAANPQPADAGIEPSHRLAVEFEFQLRVGSPSPTHEQVLSVTALRDGDRYRPPGPLEDLEVRFASKASPGDPGGSGDGSSAAPNFRGFGRLIWLGPQPGIRLLEVNRG